MVQIPETQFSPNSDRYDVTLIFEAAKVGNVEFLVELTHSYPDLLWQLNQTQISIFHIAVSCRQESVFNLIYEIGGNRDSLAGYANSKTKDNMLHLAGQLAPLHRLTIVSGAALQMQRELLWFKVSDNIILFALLIANIMVKLLLVSLYLVIVGDKKDCATFMREQVEFKKENTYGSIYR
jgi:hypothetical protein